MGSEAGAAALEMGLAHWKIDGGFSLLLPQSQPRLRTWERGRAGSAGDNVAS